MNAITVSTQNQIDNEAPFKFIKSTRTIFKAITGYT